MEKTFKEVAHLYLGCKCVLNLSDAEDVPPNYIGTLDKIDTGVLTNQIFPIELTLTIGDYEAGEDDEVKPILHRLEDMTFEDVCSLYCYQDKIFISETKCHKYTAFEYKWVHEDKDRNLADGYSYSGICTPLINSKFSVNELTFLLSKHYDLFNLIDNGHAIDAKTL
jgi:hypothetical protein